MNEDEQLEYSIYRAWTDLKVCSESMSWEEMLDLFVRYFPQDYLRMTMSLRNPKTYKPVCALLQPK